VKAIVGLGNPGAQYKGTRHNVGFAVLDELARRRSVQFESSPAVALMARSRAGTGGGFGGSDDVLLVKPLTFMNLSGQAVGELARYFKIEVADLLTWAIAAAARKSGAVARSAGGHNGLK
jgi:PTH1 family peptidyl-tRNA hydrolase